MSEGYLQSYCKMTEEEKKDELAKFPTTHVSAVLVLLTIMGELIYGNLPLPAAEA